MNKQIFLQRGNIFELTESNFTQHSELPKGIYNLCVSKSGLYLEKIGEEFKFDFKLYGIDNTLVKHVLDTYHKNPIKSNLGVLLNGAKGTGKTVTAKLLANKLNLPIVVVSANYPGLDDFISKINQDCVFFFDEFEKNFATSSHKADSEAGSSLLSIMDGVYNNGNSHVFILTTNELYVNDNLISRPSRIRYIKSFGKVMSRDILKEFVEDSLNDKTRIKEVMDFVDTLEMATIDIVKSIVEEINIHECPISEFKEFFNIRTAQFRYSYRKWNIEDDEWPGEKNEYTKEQFIKDCKEYRREKQHNNPGYDYANTNIPIRQFRKGDRFDNMIVEHPIDKNGFMTCTHPNYSHCRFFVYIERPDAGPSLYSTYDTYGYRQNSEARCEGEDLLTYESF